MDIKILKIIQEFKSSINKNIVGMYEIEVNESKYIITRNGNEVKAITHGLDSTKLNLTTKSLTEEVLRLLGDKVHKPLLTMDIIDEYY